MAGDLWGTLFNTALQGALQFGGSYYQNQQNKEQHKQDLQEQKDLATFKAGLIPEPAGPAGPFTGFTDPQKVQAIQNQNSQSMQAIDAIIKAYQAALLGGR